MSRRLLTAEQIITKLREVDSESVSSATSISALPWIDVLVARKTLQPTGVAQFAKLQSIIFSHEMIGARPSGNFEVYYINVGQGGSTLIIHGYRLSRGLIAAAAA